MSRDDVPITGEPGGEKAAPEELDGDAAASLASLVGIGCQSGDTVMGLSAVRRTRELAFVFADAGVADGTMAQLARLQRMGTRVYRVSPLSEMTQKAGRGDVSVLGVKRGSLADGIGKKLVKGPKGS